MESPPQARVESEAMGDFAQIMNSPGDILHPRNSEENLSLARLNIDPERLKNGLGQLVLTLVKLLHELLERQALQRIDNGSLSAEQIERIGLTLMRQAEEIERLRIEFGLKEEDLNLDLGPLGRVF